ncbi:hypothetical protein SAMN05518847_1275 [Paenibacillus sp. OV219]|nr:hypothetical protein SAMN05518847_1275 [Paenibacillus sp. OV219]
MVDQKRNALSASSDGYTSWDPVREKSLVYLYLSIVIFYNFRTVYLLVDWIWNGIPYISYLNVINSWYS